MGSDLQDLQELQRFLIVRRGGLIANRSWDGLAMLREGVFAVFTLFTLFFDGAGGGIECKNRLLRCFFVIRITWEIIAHIFY